MREMRKREKNIARSGETISESSPRPTFVMSLVCTACGAEARRGNAKFCLICGKLLKEDYQPLDTLRSSYRFKVNHF